MPHPDWPRASGPALAQRTWARSRLSSYSPCSTYVVGSLLLIRTGAMFVWRWTFPSFRWGSYGRAELLRAFTGLQAPLASLNSLRRLAISDVSITIFSGIIRGRQARNSKLYRSYHREMRGCKGSLWNAPLDVQHGLHACQQATPSCKQCKRPYHGTESHVSDGHPDGCLMPTSKYLLRPLTAAFWAG